MNETVATLNLEIEEIETAGRPGCQNSSSTSPRCTCPPPVIEIPRD
jgi:hypothetical protein